MNIFLSAKNKHLNLRKETIKDNDFLYSLYASTREVELSMTSWSEEEKKRFLKSQFELRKKDYKNKFENGYFFIINKKKKPIGRVLLNIDKTLHIVDIALIKKERSCGYGTLILEDLINYAKKLNIPIFLNVSKDNFLAMKLYQRLGFIVNGEDGFYYNMMKENYE